MARTTTVRTTTARTTRFALLALALLAALLAGTAAPAAAAPGSVTVTVESIGGGPDVYGFYDLGLQPTGGGAGGAAHRGATPGEPVTLTAWNGSEFTPDIEPGSYVLNVGVGGPGTNAGTLASRPVVVPDGGDVDVEITVDDRLACIAGTVRNADGTPLDGFALQTSLPGTAAYPAFQPNPATSVFEFDEAFFGCGIARGFTVSALDLDTFEPIGVAAGVARPGETVLVDVVIGSMEEPAVQVTGGKVVTASDGRPLITVWAGSTDDLTLTFPVTCPGGGAATSVEVAHGASVFAATNTPPGGDVWTATIDRADLVNGGILATATCPGGDAVHDLGSVLLYDPSGFVTDAVTGEPVVGATVRLYEVEGWRPRTDPTDLAAQTCESNDSKAPGTAWSQPAATADGVLATQAGLDGRTSPDVPEQVTDDEGHYAWDVAYGCWYVTVEADGYEPLTSPMVGVPPEVTDLDLELTPTGTPGPCATPPFPDVPTASNFCADIEWLADEGIAGGYPDGTFKPTNPVSRQAMAAFLHRYTGQPEPAGPCDTTGGFPDVPANHQFCHEIMWMVGEGLSNGYPDGDFKPTNAISRQAMSAFLFRLAGQTEAGTCPGTGFPDVGLAHSFCHEVAWMVANDITDGYPDGTFKPTNPISRQAAAAFLHRYDALPVT